MIDLWSGFYGWLLLSIVIIIISAVINRRLKIGAQFVFVILGSLVSFQVLFALQGSSELFISERPQLHNFWFALGLIFAVNAAIKLLQWLFIESVVNRSLLHMPPFVVNLFGWLASLVAAFLIIRYVFSVELTSLLISSTVVTAVIGLSLQQVLTSLFVGIILQLETPFVVGDWVKVGDYEGKLEYMSWRTLALRTRLDNLVIFANSDIADERIVNYSRPMRRQGVSVTVSASYPNPPGKVKAALEEMMQTVNGVLSEPEPMILVKAFGATGVDYVIHFWIDDYAKRTRIQDEVLTFAWYALHRVGAGDPFGITDINILSAETTAAEAAAKHQIIYENLRTVPLFIALSDEQVHQLTDSAELHNYTSAESLVQQGDSGDSLFIIVTGTVGVWLDVANESGNEHIRIDEKTAGQFFGEKSLLTGEARTATVKAESETQVITLNSQALRHLLTDDAELVGKLADAFALNKSNLQTQKEAAEEQLSRQTNNRQRLMQRISTFLGIQ